MMQIPLRQALPASSLFFDYVEDWTRVQRFYPHDHAFESILDFIRKRPALDASHRDRLCAALGAQQQVFGASQLGVEKLAAGAVAVVTGQQPGLFTGPNLSIIKAISAVKLARQIERVGVPAVPVFWIAAEDHDYQEIETACVLDRSHRLFRMRVDLSNAEPTPAGWAAYREDVHACIRECMAALPDSEFAPEIRDILESSYRPGISPVEAFGRMMAALFADTDLVFANPLHPELRRLAKPVLERAVARNSDVRAAVIARSRALSEAGYHEQVKVEEHFTGFFVYRGRSRQALRPAELGPDLQLSPNVLLRPVMQDAIFPTAAYVAGPAEVAYFAQAAAVYETLGCVMPPVFPRISATLLEPPIVRALEKYGIQFADVLMGRDFLKRKAVESVQDGESFDLVGRRIEEQIESLRPVLASVDPTLEGALEKSRQKMMHQLETLRARYVTAVARRDEILERHVETIGNSLLPDRKLQERLINTTSFLTRYGAGLIRRLDEKLPLDPRQHYLVEI